MLANARNEREDGGGIGLIDGVGERRVVPGWPSDTLPESSTKFILLTFLLFLFGLLDAFKAAQCWLSADRRPSLTPILKLQLAPPGTFHSLSRLRIFLPVGVDAPTTSFRFLMTRRYKRSLIALYFPPFYVSTYAVRVGSPQKSIPSSIIKILFPS
ncbi:hypothetical protein IW262DRAFT_378435 [Armillaria fumosa]|nr:hypothetical protein IW262DRAFT_378435 [Armillaria fumosa]